MEARREHLRKRILPLPKGSSTLFVDLESLMTTTEDKVVHVREHWRRLPRR